MFTNTKLSQLPKIGFEIPSGLEIPKTPIITNEAEATVSAGSDDKTEDVKGKAEVADAEKTEEKKDGKFYTQDELDKLIEKRINRAKKAFEKQQEDAKKAEADNKSTEELQKLQEKIIKQNQRIVKSEAKNICSTLNVDADMIDAVVALTDLSEIDLESGDFDVDDIKDALEKTLKKYPKFVRATQAEASENTETGVFKMGVSKQTEAKGKTISEMTTKEKWRAHINSKS